MLEKTEKTLENPLDSKEIKPVNPKGNQPCKFIGKTGAVCRVGHDLVTEQEQRGGEDEKILCV